MSLNKGEIYAVGFGPRERKGNKTDRRHKFTSVEARAANAKSQESKLAKAKLEPMQEEPAFGEAVITAFDPGYVTRRERAALRPVKRRTKPRQLRLPGV